MNFLVIFIFVSIASGFTEVQKLITKSLIDHFQIKHCILASSTKHKLSTFNDFKLLSGWKIVSNVKSPTELSRYVIVELYPHITQSTVGTKNKAWENTKKLLMPKTLIIFQDTKVDVIINLFYSSRYYLSTFTWVAFLDEHETKFLREIRVPYNAEFIAINKENTTYALSEIFLVKKNTPFLINYGTWDQENGLRINRPDLSLYERRLNMNGTFFYAQRLLRATADKVLNSYHTEILGDFEKMMNITIRKDSRIPFGEVPTITDLNYIMSDSTYSRDNVGPIIKISSYLYIKQPDVKKSSIYFLLPFSYHLWLALLNFIIQATVVNILLHFIFKYKYSEEKIKWIDSVFQTFETFCDQCGGKQSELYTSRVIISTISLFFIIITSAFSAVLQSHLIVTTFSPPFKNLDELIEGKTYSVGAIYTGYEKIYFQSNPDPYYQKIYRILMERNNRVLSFTTGFNRVCNEKFAQIAHEYEARTTPVNCKLFQIRDPVITRLTAIRFQVNSYGIKEVFAYKLLWFYSSGIIHRFQKHLKDFQLKEESTDYFPVEIDQILYVTGIIVVGILLSSVIFIFELALAFCKNSKAGNNCVKKIVRAMACEIKSSA